jgi:tetratricopeptide (TPR) repeat protein
MMLAAAGGAAVRCTMTTAALGGSSSYADGLRANAADHISERELSESLGFQRAAAAVSVAVPIASHQVSKLALGMGDACPFCSDELIYETRAPLFSAAECAAVRDEASSRISEGASSSFTMTSTNRDVAVHDLPETLAWLNGGALARVASLAATCFPGAVDRAESLWVYRGLVICYDAAAGLTHQPIHRDGALISCVVPLSASSEYEGGGTYVEPLERAFALEQGCALLHPSAIRHAGHRITSGHRWVLVLFLNGLELSEGDHGRRFHARAREFLAASQGEEEEEDEEGEEDAEEGEEEEGEEDEEDEEGFVLCEEDEDEDEDGDDEETDGEVQCLLHALQATDESDHAVWYDLGARAHDLGDTHEALRLYERACALNSRDPLLLSNMGVALLELGRPREAFRYYRRALRADAHDVNARFNAGELLLAMGRLHGLAVLLAEAPEDAMRDEMMAALREELESAQDEQDEQDEQDDDEQDPHESRAPRTGE